MNVPSNVALLDFICRICFTSNVNKPCVFLWVRRPVQPHDHCVNGLILKTAMKTFDWFCELGLLFFLFVATPILAGDLGDCPQSPARRSVLDTDFSSPPPESYPIRTPHPTTLLHGGGRINHRPLYCGGPMGVTRHRLQDKERQRVCVC